MSGSQAARVATVSSTVSAIPIPLSPNTHPQSFPAGLHHCLAGRANSDKAAAVFARQDAWHRLGTTLAGEAFTAEDAMRLGHLGGGWDVRKVPLSAIDLTQDRVTSLDVPSYATVCINPFTQLPDALGLVGSGSLPLKNEEDAEFLNLLADQSGAIFDTAGSLRGGR